MSKCIFRITAFFLVPCLIADPTLAAALSQQSMLEHSIKSLICEDCFGSEALAARVCLDARIIPASITNGLHSLFTEIRSVRRPVRILRFPDVPSGGNIASGFTEVERQAVLERATPVAEETTILLRHAVLRSLGHKLKVPWDPASQDEKTYIQRLKATIRIKFADHYERGFLIPDGSVENRIGAEKSDADYAIAAIDHMMSTPIMSFANVGYVYAIQDQDKYMIEEGNADGIFLLQDLLSEISSREASEALIEILWHAYLEAVTPRGSDMQGALAIHNAIIERFQRSLESNPKATRTFIRSFINDRVPLHDEWSSLESSEPRPRRVSAFNREAKIRKEIRGTYPDTKRKDETHVIFIGETDYSRQAHLQSAPLPSDSLSRYAMARINELTDFLILDWTIEQFTTWDLMREAVELANAVYASTWIPLTTNTIYATQPMKVLGELLKNAVSAYSEAEKSGPIRLLVGRNSRSWIIEIADNGIGFTHKLGKISELSRSGWKARGHIGGQAHGFALSRLVVKIYGGTLDVIRGDGKEQFKTTIRLTIPIDELQVSFSSPEKRKKALLQRSS